MTLEEPQNQQVKILQGHFQNLYFAFHHQETAFLVGPFCHDSNHDDYTSQLARIDMPIETRYLLDAYLQKRLILQTDVLECLGKAIGAILINQDIVVESFSADNQNSLGAKFQDLCATPINAQLDKYILEDEVEKRYAIEHKLCSVISSGDLVSLDALLKQVNGKLRIPSRVKISVTDWRYLAITLNSIGARACFHGGVSASIVDYVSSRNIKLIDRIDNLAQFEQLQATVMREYCQIVQRYSLNHYSALIKNSIILLRQNLNQDAQGLATLAAELNVSKEHLARQFKKETKQTISQYRNQLRIEESLPFLVTKQHSVESLAEQLGFCSTAYYRKVFKQVMGSTPATYCERTLPEMERQRRTNK